MRRRDPELNVRGEAVFVDDLPLPAGAAFGAVLPSPAARGRITRLDTGRASDADGVLAVLTATDIPGENQIGAIIEDEPLLADREVHYVGQPIALVVALSPEQARDALALVELEIEELEPVLDPEQAFARGSLIAPPTTLDLGDVDRAWADCRLVVEGRVRSGAQEHAYLETQSAVAWPAESAGLRVVSSTQAPTAVQRAVARVLGLPMHQVEVDVGRLGGGFGGKEDQATPWAALAALAAQRLRRPVKVVLERGEDMRITGKRHPYVSDFKLGLDAEGRILAFEVRFLQDSGAAADLSTAVLERSILHATNCYAIPNVRITAACCRTNSPPNTALRGFGAPQAMFVIESAIDLAARRLGLPAARIQRANLLAEGDTLPCGMRVERCEAVRAWDEADRRFGFEQRRREIAEQNQRAGFVRRGMALMPICFGISFTNTFLNQAGALVHVYGDGSVGVSTGAVEMGQGVAEKIARVAARTLGIARSRVKVESTNTSRVANTSPTAASTGADMNGHATSLACRAIRERLVGVAAGAIGVEAGRIAIEDGEVRVGGRRALGWDELVRAAYVGRVGLSAQAHYATPGIQFDKATGKGKPFAYHVYGVALVEAEVDLLRGTYRVDTVRLLHDAGESLDPLIDRGQIEGALVQGLGMMLLEQIARDGTGRLLTDRFDTYKIPDIDFAPKTIDVALLPGSACPLGPFNSKAIGEPPLLYGVGAWFAVADALRAFEPRLEIAHDAPWSPERVLLLLAGQG